MQLGRNFLDVARCPYDPIGESRDSLSVTIQFSDDKFGFLKLALELRSVHRSVAVGFLVG